MSVAVTPAMQDAAEKTWNNVVQGDASKQKAGLNAAIFAAIEVLDREQPPIRIEQLRLVFDQDRMLIAENERLRTENERLQTKRPRRVAWLIVGFALSYLLASATFGLMTYASNRSEPWDAGIIGLSWPTKAVELLQAETWPHAPAPTVSAPPSSTSLAPSSNREVNSPPESKAPLAQPKR